MWIPLRNLLSLIIRKHSKVPFSMGDVTEDPCHSNLLGGHRMTVRLNSEQSPFIGNGSDLLHLELLNAGVLYITKDLYIVVHNELARKLLDSSVALNQPVLLKECFDKEHEEYQILANLIFSERELRDAIVKWETNGRIRHILVDTFLDYSDAHRVEGMYVVIKDLGNFSAIDQQMQRSERLAIIGKIAAGIAHEIRNPLTTVKGFLQMLENRFTGNEMQSELTYTHMMLTEIENVNALVTELLLLSKPHVVDKEPCTVTELLSDMMPHIEKFALEQGICFTADVQFDGLMTVDKSMMKQALLNLVKNAIEAMETGGSLRILVCRTENHIQIDVVDTGPGIPYYQIDKIFDAFYTTKDKGTGLGLPICQRIIANHGGEIRISSKGFGTTFSVFVPLFIL
jgi:two-component system, sporulation sensor kinase E